MTYIKMLRNLKMEHEEKMHKRQHPKLCRQKPCQMAWLIAFLESHPPQEEVQLENEETLSYLVRNERR